MRSSTAALLLVWVELGACSAPAPPAHTAALPAASQYAAEPEEALLVALSEAGITEAQASASAARAPPPARPPPPEFPDRLSIEALDRLSHAVPVHHDAHGSTLRLGTDDLFESGTATLSSRARWRLDAIASALALQYQRKIFVRVYTDSLGNRAQSTDLSLHRAEALRDYFVAHGAIPEQLVAEGMGPSHPVDDNRTTQGRAANRRVEIVVETPQPR